MAIHFINDHRIDVPDDMTPDAWRIGPGEYDKIIFMGTEICTFECEPEPELYTGPFGVSADDGEVFVVESLDAARAKIMELGAAGRIYFG